MAVKFRLQRWGSKRKPFYFVVVSDSRTPRDGRMLEKVGVYDPRMEPSRVEIKGDRVKHWYGVGARPTDSVKRLFKIANLEL